MRASDSIVEDGLGLKTNIWESLTCRWSGKRMCSLGWEGEANRMNKQRLKRAQHQTQQVFLLGKGELRH